MIRTALAAALLCLAATPTLGDDDGNGWPLKMARHIFMKADTNSDGVLTQKEHKSAGLGRFGVSFGDFDSDSDSRVTWEEYRALFERYHRPAGEKEA